MFRIVCWWGEGCWVHWNQADVALVSVSGLCITVTEVFGRCLRWMMTILKDFLSCKILDLLIFINLIALINLDILLLIYICPYIYMYNLAWKYNPFYSD